MSDLLIVIHHVAQVISAAIVCFANAHGVVRQVDVAVVAEDCSLIRISIILKYMEEIQLRSDTYTSASWRFDLQRNL